MIDYTFVYQNVCFRVHKSILARWSTYFNLIFEHQKNQDEDDCFFSTDLGHKAIYPSTIHWMFDQLYSSFSNLTYPLWTRTQEPTSLFAIRVLANYFDITKLMDWCNEIQTQEWSFYYEALKEYIHKNEIHPAVVTDMTTKGYCMMTLKKDPTLLVLGMDYKMKLANSSHKGEPYRMDLDCLWKHVYLVQEFENAALARSIIEVILKEYDNPFGSAQFSTYQSKFNIKTKSYILESLASLKPLLYKDHAWMEEEKNGCVFLGLKLEHRVETDVPYVAKLMGPMGHAHVTCKRWKAILALKSNRDAFMEEVYEQSRRTSTEDMIHNDHETSIYLDNTRPSRWKTFCIIQ
jgi:hypothetical protein